MVNKVANSQGLLRYSRQLNIHLDKLEARGRPSDTSCNECWERSYLNNFAVHSGRTEEKEGARGGKEKGATATAREGRITKEIPTSRHSYSVAGRNLRQREGDPEHFISSEEKSR